MARIQSIANLPAVIAPPRSPEIVGTHALDIDDGIVLVGSDCHYRPDESASTAHRAFVELTSRFAEEGLLRAVIINGDVTDFTNLEECEDYVGVATVDRRRD